MPFDRRRRGYLRYLLAFLPWKTQDRLGDFAFDHPPFWHTLAALAALYLLGPWPLAGVLVGALALKAWRERGRRLRLTTRHRAAWPVERAIWTVRVAENWRWKLLRRFGVLWLPVPAPLAGGDIVLFDLRSLRQEELELPTFYLAGRVGYPGSASHRRHRRLVRLAALWTLEDPLPLLELKETYAAWPKAMGVTPGHPAPPPQPLVRTVEPTDEDRVTHRHRLLAKVSVREARKPNWREERGARDLFHKLWGMAHDHDNYDKPLWGDLQGKLRGAGVWV